MRVEAAQVGHLDLDVVAGDFPGAAPPPLVPGTESAGVVVQSDGFEPGTRVRVRGARTGIARDGCWAEHVVVPDGAVRRVPGEVPAWLAAAFFSPACTAWAAVHDVTAVRPGERVLVTGASGAVGRLAVQLAVEAGAEVTGVVGREWKRAHVPAPAGCVLAEELQDLGAEFDVLVDTVGGAPFRLAVATVRAGGRAAVLGYSAGRDLALDMQHFVFSDVRLLPVNLLRRGPGLLEEADLLLARLCAGELDLPVRRTGPDGLAGACADLRAGEVVGKLALVWDA